MKSYEVIYDFGDGVGAASWTRPEGSSLQASRLEASRLPGLQDPVSQPPGLGGEGGGPSQDNMMS